MFYYIILFYFNPPKSVGGMEREGQNKFGRDSKFSGGSRRNGGIKECFITLFFFQSSKICLRNGGRGTENFDRDSEFSRGSRRNGGRQVCFITLFCFILILQNLLEE